MPQASKILESRQNWKEKAIKLSKEAREGRKTQKRHKTKIAELKTQLENVALENLKKDFNPNALY